LLEVITGQSPKVYMLLHRSSKLKYYPNVTDSIRPPIETDRQRSITISAITRLQNEVLKF